MTTVHHVLKDGTKVNDIKDHVIKADDFKVLYEIINRIQKTGGANEAIRTSEART